MRKLLVVLALVLLTGCAVAAASPERPVPTTPRASVVTPLRVVDASTTTTTTTTTTTIPPTTTTTTTAAPRPRPQPRQSSGDQGFLACVRAHESDTAGGYSAQNPTSSASGAYQIINSTWGNFMGYPTAASAPPWVQDLRATQLPRSAWHGTGCPGT